MDDENNFDIEAFFVADAFEAHVYNWYKDQCLVGNATLLLAEKWNNRKYVVQKIMKDLIVIGEFIRDDKKDDACSWINNVLSEEAKELITPDIYEYLQLR